MESCTFWAYMAKPCTSSSARSRLVRWMLTVSPSTASMISGVMWERITVPLTVTVHLPSASQVRSVVSRPARVAKGDFSSVRLFQPDL